MTLPEDFVSYIYNEYWADDLIHDRFVPTDCIRAHFVPGIEWTYGIEGEELSGSYHGLEEMSFFLRSFGEKYKVHAWRASNIVFEQSDPNPRHELRCRVTLESRYEDRTTRLIIQRVESHRLTLVRVGPIPAESPWQIASVVIEVSPGQDRVSPVQASPYLNPDSCSPYDTDVKW